MPRAPRGRRWSKLFRVPFKSPDVRIPNSIRISARIRRRITAVPPAAARRTQSPPSGRRDGARVINASVHRADHLLSQGVPPRPYSAPFAPPRGPPSLNAGQRPKSRSTPRFEPEQGGGRGRGLPDPAAAVPPTSGLRTSSGARYSVPRHTLPAAGSFCGAAPFGRRARPKRARSPSRPRPVSRSSAASDPLLAFATHFQWALVGSTTV